MKRLCGTAVQARPLRFLTPLSRCDYGPTWPDQGLMEEGGEVSGPSLHNSCGICKYNYGQENMEIPCGDVYTIDYGNENLWIQSVSTIYIAI